jgi:hypothetical protein
MVMSIEYRLIENINRRHFREDTSGERQPFDFDEDYSKCGVFSHIMSVSISFHMTGVTAACSHLQTHRALYLYTHLNMYRTNSSSNLLQSTLMGNTSIISTHWSGAHLFTV